MLGSIKDAREVFSQHGFSRNHQIRILDMAGVPDYVRNEILYRPTGLGGAVYATSLSVPGREIQNMPLTYQGFTFHLEGMPAYTPNPWTVTFRTPGDFLVRNALERWSFEIVSDETSCGTFNIPCPSTTIDVAVLSPGCTIERVYRLVGVYPQSIGQISYNTESNDPTTFDCAFHYQYWRPVIVNDSALIDVDNSDRAQIEAVYQSYESAILANNGKSCATNFTQPAV